MGFLDKMFGVAPSQKTPEQAERDRLAEKAIADAKEKGISGGEVLEFSGTPDERAKPRSYTGQEKSREDDRAA